MRLNLYYLTHSLPIVIFLFTEVTVEATRFNATSAKVLKNSNNCSIWLSLFQSFSIGSSTEVQVLICAVFKLTFFTSVLAMQYWAQCRLKKVQVSCLGMCISSFLLLEKSPLNAYICYFSNDLILHCATWGTAGFQVSTSGIFLSSPAIQNVCGFYMTTLEVLMMKCIHCIQLYQKELSTSTSFMVRSVWVRHLHNFLKWQWLHSVCSSSFKKTLDSVPNGSLSVWMWTFLSAFKEKVFMHDKWFFLCSVESDWYSVYKEDEDVWFLKHFSRPVSEEAHQRMRNECILLLYISANTIYW